MRLLAVLFVLALTRLQAAEFFPFDADGVACCLVNEGDAVWRVRTATADGSFAEVGAVQSLARWMGEPMPGHRTPLTRSEAAGVVTLRAKDGTRTEIRRKPFSLSFFAADGTCVKRLTGIAASGGRVRAEGALADGEHVMGLGQRLDGLDLRGRRLSVCTTDGYNDSSSSYMAIPFFLTSAGGGVFANGYEFATADFGVARPDRWVLEQWRKTLDLYVFAVRTPAESVMRLTGLSGRPSVPERWSAGPVICRYSPDLSVLEGATSGDRRGVRFLGYGIKDIVSKYLAEGVKPTAVICEAWGTGLFEGTPEQSARKRAATKEAADWLAAKGMRMMVWMSLGNPLSMNAPGFKKEYLVSVDVETNGVRAAKGLVRVPEVRLGKAKNPDVSKGSRGRFILDITNPEAWRWYVDVMWGELVRCGVRGAKIDFCEEFPDEGFAYGTTRYHYRWRHPEVFAGAAVHHAYPVFFISRLYRELSARLRDRGGFSVLSRGGGIGSQRAPWLWAGDQVRQFEKLDDQILAVLSSGLSGVPFMTFDAAGYQYAKLKVVPAAVYDPKTGTTDVSRTEPRDGEKPVCRRDSHVTSAEEESRIFARGIELAAWTGCVQTHGFVRHPYELGERTRKIYRDSMRRFAELAPYRDRLFAEAVKTGVPPVRALAFAYPDDPVAWTVEDEFMLGDRYLVAPVLSDATARSVYLPEGRWKCLRTGKVRDVPAGGLRFDVRVPLDEIAVYVRIVLPPKTASVFSVVEDELELKNRKSDALMCYNTLR